MAMAQGLDDDGRQSEGPARALRLRCRLRYLVLALELAPKVKHAAVEVDVAPRQPEQLAGPKPKAHAGHDERLEAVTLDR